MSIKTDSRNELTIPITPVSAITGLPVGPTYLDLRDRIPADQTDRVVELRDHQRSPAVLATQALNDPRLWWAIADVSAVVDPFDLNLGDRLRVPNQDRLVFSILGKAQE